MGKSIAKHPFLKIAGKSDKKSRTVANKRLRCKVRLLLRKGLDFFPLLRELSDLWNFNSDGGSRYYRNLDKKWRRR